jgi:hypothetical protein
MSKEHFVNTCVLSFFLSLIFCVCLNVLLQKPLKGQLITWLFFQFLISTFGELKKLAKLIKLVLEKKKFPKNCQFFGYKKQQKISGKKKKNCA